MTKGTYAAINPERTHNYYIIEHGISFSVGPFIIYPFNTEHDAVEPVGFLISHPSQGKLIYATDTFYLRYKFVNVNYYMVECNYCHNILQERRECGELDDLLYNRLMTSHMSLERTKEFLQSCDLRRTRNIILVHMSRDNSDIQSMVHQIQTATGIPTTAADKGKKIELSLYPF